MPLHLHESGSPTAPALLFLHGSPLSGRMWHPQLQNLTEYHCLAPDLPGHGQSASRPWTGMTALAQELATLIRDRTPTGRAHIVGLSFGGVVAQAMMVHTPEVVDHVILSGTSTRLARWLVLTQKLNEPILRLLSPNQLAALVCMQFGIPKETQNFLRDDFKDFSAQTLSKVLETYGDIEMPAKSTSPTLAVAGAQETFVAKQAARALAKGIPHAQGALIPNAGHVWNLQHPILFNNLVRAWVTQEKLPEGIKPF
ncbi:MAG: alpha/beta fold hydrolase [Anaerolineales bacterium]|nr:alpha/beta fold hydrolase [Anaerolineales bacterium]